MVDQSIPVDLSHEPDAAGYNRLVNSDVVDALAMLPAHIRFDLVIADPPYNIGKDFGTTQDAMGIAEYVEWSCEWLDLCRERLKEDGLIYVYGFPETLAHVAVRFPLREQRWLVWHYTNKTVPSSAFWQRSHESILCLWKAETKRPSLEIGQIREPYTLGFLHGAAGKKRKGTESRFSRGGRDTTYNAHESGALPRDVLKHPALAGGAGAVERWFMCRTCERRIFAPSMLNEHRGHDILKHPTQKPMALTRRLIRSRIRGEGRVFIPFAGSGSECVAAQQMGVDFFAAEINPEYVEFAQKWLESSHV